MNRIASSASFVRRLALRPVVVLLLAGIAATSTALAQQGNAGNPGNQGTGSTAPPSRIEERRLGEEEQIRERLEWFYSSRRAGTTSDAELWSLRLQGVRQTRLALEQQRLRRSSGFEGLENFWVSKGPSPSTFGTWTFGNVAGRIQAIEADWSGGVLYVGAAAGGVWKSTNDGLSWTNIFDTAGTVAVGAITVDPNNPGVLWVGTGDNIVSCESYFGIGLLRSSDGGATWEQRNGSGANTLEELAAFSNVIVDPRDSSHLVVGGRNRGCASGSDVSGGLYTSNDGGLTWTKRLANVQIHEIAQDPSVLDVFWAGTSVGVYKSVDNAQTWTLQTGSGLPSGSTGRTEIAIAPSNSNTVYALFASGTSFWRTTDGGATWNQMSSGSNACDGQCWYNMTLAVHNTDPDIVYRGTIRIFKSVNGGSSWSDLSNGWGSSQTVHQDMHRLLMDPNDPDAFYASGDGGLWKSEDGGGSFSNRNGNLNITQFYAIGVDAADPGRICGGAQDNSSLARDNNDVWDRQAVTGDGFVCYIDPQNPNRAYITSYPSGGYPNVWRSTSGLFGSFFDITGGGSGIIGGDRINWVTPYILDPVSPNILYLGTHRLYRSDNNGSSWTQVGPGDLTAGSGSLKALEVNPNFPGYVFTGSASGRVWRTDGTSWSDITTGLPARAINDIGADPSNPDRAFAVVGGFNTSHVWEWNSGSGWTGHDGGLPNVPANTVLMLTDTYIVVGTDTGVFRSFDGGQTFSPFMDGLPEGVVVTDLKFNPQQNVLTAGTYGRGAWQVSIDPVQPLMILDSIAQPLVELDGDGDTNVEPGETWEVRPVLRNAGGETAMDVSARLTTTSPGVTLLDDTSDYGDVAPGTTAQPLTPYRFAVEPSFVCGDDMAFDLVDITSSNPPGSHADRPDAFVATVIDANASPITTTLVDENFEGGSPTGWSHEPVDAGLAECAGYAHPDEWDLASKDAAHGLSYHCGNGAGSIYTRGNYSWLYTHGKDSEGGPGIQIPADAIAATLTIVHWYDTIVGEDGGQVAVDTSQNGQDVYSTLNPVSGYPGGPLATGNCNGLGGRNAFQGSSGGWVTSMFNLMPFVGERIWPAFVFGADKAPAAGEGWYIDEVKIEFQQTGPPICHVSQWPGSVATAQFELLDASTIQATWDDSCNVGAFPAQTYSIQAGDLDALLTGGAYNHVPTGGLCDRTSTSTFSPGPGNEYYLVVPSADGREGGAGVDSAGVPRPQTSTVCGEQRVDCP